MAKPAHYTSKVAIPLPSDETVRRIIGKSYSPEKTLNVIKMFAGTEDLFEATIGLVKAIFQTQGIDPKLREMIILRAATVLNAPYEWQANTQMAKNAGLSSKEIDAAGSDGPVAGINPDLERFMAKRMGAKTIEIEASHLALISHPDAITNLILEALAV